MARARKTITTVPGHSMRSWHFESGGVSDDIITGRWTTVLQAMAAAA